MNKFDTGDDSGVKSFFVKGCIIIAVAVVFLFIGSMFTIGMVSVINRVSPSDLLKGEKAEQQEQQTQKEKVQESEKEKPAQGESVQENTELPGLEEKKVGRVVTLEGFDDAISSVVEEVKSSVVNIRVKVKQKDVFGDEHLVEGLGSGVIYTEDGYIITNNHVAGEAVELLVTLYDGSQYPAELVGTDKNTDVAVIKIDAENLKASRFTSIENAKVGEIAIAIGSPFGLNQTVTMGVISAKGRDIAVSSDTLPMVDLIQTDAAINQGNSGGPLINSAGQVIGINNLIYSPSGANAGIGFAIPSDTAVNIAGQIMKYGKAKLPFMGIEMGENKTDIAGVYIQGVMERYPAEEAGLKEGDIIVEFDGTDVKTPYELLAQILRHNVRDVIQLRVYRNGGYLMLSLELVEAPVVENTK